MALQLWGFLAGTQCACASSIAKTRDSTVAASSSVNVSQSNGADWADSLVDDDAIAAEVDERWAAAERESLAILEWPAVCKQVACFCGTSVAADLVARGGLPRGRSRAESELLLQQTQEALEAGLNVGGLFDIRPAAEAAAGGVCLTGKQLEGVAATLEAAFELKERVTVAAEGGQQGGGFRYPSLAALAAAITGEERTLLRAIRGCIQYGAVSDAASESLAAVRAERQANKERLRAEVEGWARQLQQKGAAEAGAVSLIRGRFCVGVRAGRQGELPKGSVRLGQSSTGATLYLEPKPAVELNNAEALLAEREEGEVLRVLSMLSTLLAKRAPQLMRLVDCITALDVVVARAKHARWLSGVRPAFTADPSESPFWVPGALHPVLMQRGLPPLPQPPSVDDNRFDRDFQAAPAWELRRVLTPDGPRPGELADGSAAGRGSTAAAADERASLLPRPLDLRVPSSRAVVAITGPNTGGKTVTLKTAGLMTLMAQAGLFLPCDPAAAGAAAAAAAAATPRLAWFDRVLADIGDAQSLQQNLSTFSGHIRRIKQILAVAGPRSLVLLDEVGSGTDPLEGAALARAVLDRLAEQAHLTLATTHHAELKRASEEDGRYVNVSMAFDTATLRPTYRLCWGAAGASNALDIAETLGFDRSVVLEARKVAAMMAASASAATAAAAGGGGGEGRESHIAGVARSLVQQIEDTRQELEGQRALRERHSRNQTTLSEAVAQVRELEAALLEAPPEIVRERDGHAVRVQAALEAFAAGAQPQDVVEEQLREIESLIPAEVAALRGRGYVGDDDDEESLRPGDSVYVRSRGDMGDARVVSVKGDTVTVKFATSVLFGGGRDGGRGVKLSKREVKKVTKGSSMPTLGERWEVEGFQSVMGDMARVLGETAEQERRAAEAAARRREQRARVEMEQLASEAGQASWADLYDQLGVQELEADLELAEGADFGSEELSALAAVLQEAEEGAGYDVGAEEEGGPRASAPVRAGRGKGAGSGPGRAR
ncbi:hypothetical protein HXX76_001149 [Chlamydomonas incerta]|uniref:DNA mismatch repair proteins mutS family domain-containing protein n=1 Tax=Chlamydomonas incerta TaxID=51695 RepID=A0A836B0X4_CHLIN|nr:hypothetical protein HXX76_001149 [Chlamydomonas incerta]|eukprot:KAG2444396.1 hypothetical protein HXX76_001149 [Chlamydomonas incerta]